MQICIIGIHACVFCYECVSMGVVIYWNFFGMCDVLAVGMFEYARSVSLLIVFGMNMCVCVCMFEWVGESKCVYVCLNACDISYVYICDLINLTFRYVCLR
jgi:hypothetical protein